MVYQSFELPPAPDAPLSLLAMIKRAASAYSATFKLSMGLFWLPNVILALSGLPLALTPSPSTVSVQTVLHFGSVLLLALAGLVYYLWITVRRGLALKRLVLLAEDSCVPSLAFSNRLGWKAVVARFAAFVVQNTSAIICIVLGVLSYNLPGITHASMRFHLMPDLSLPFVLIIVALTAISFFCYFFTEFLYLCFAVVLATECSDWASLMRRSCELARSSFLRGSSFAFISEFTYWLLPILISPLTFHNLSIVAHGGIRPASGSSPIWITLGDCLVEFAVTLLVIPFLIILDAYFVNDVRVRWQARASRSGK